MPELGRTVRFTGTFLKMVSYAGGDGARLAPLVVGDRLPVRRRPQACRRSILPRKPGLAANGGDRHSGTTLGPAYWALGLAVLAASGRDPGPMALAYAGTARRGTQDVFSDPYPTLRWNSSSRATSDELSPIQSSSALTFSK